MSMGSQSKLGIDTVNPATAAFEFAGENLVETGSIVDTGGIRGTRSHQSERTRAGNYRVAGSIAMYPCPAELNLLLPWILGGAPVVGTPAGSTTFPLAEALSGRFVQIDRIAKVFTYAGVKVDSHSPLTTHHSPLTTHHSPLTTHH